ncbi:hypothetical protein MKEN_00695100 [Mycena kentingensis (nom. inval.)]|nr:hypothetical protein MKEN_00695100 [Mycena kentingensis (nom. inval.)]
MSDHRRMSMQGAYPTTDQQWAANAQPGYRYASAQPPVSAYRATAASAYSNEGYYSSSPTSSYASGSASPPYHHHGHGYTQQPHSPHSPTPTHGQYPYSKGYGHAPSPTSPHSPSYGAPASPISPPHQYPQQVPLQAATSYTDYAAPGRPFACDLCALSFNRQHDLKRHRETHTGEKPYLCNGGCGKTFTRKDALKRHQLVKQCGKVDDSWP